MPLLPRSTWNAHNIIERDVLVTKYHIAENFAKPSYLCIAEIFGGINFRQCSKGLHHILYVIVNAGQKFVDKTFANESRWQNW